MFRLSYRSDFYTVGLAQVVLTTRYPQRSNLRAHFEVSILLFIHGVYLISLCWRCCQSLCTILVATKEYCFSLSILICYMGIEFNYFYYYIGSIQLQSYSLVESPFILISLLYIESLTYTSMLFLVDRQGFCFLDKGRLFRVGILHSL